MQDAFISGEIGKGMFGMARYVDLSDKKRVKKKEEIFFSVKKRGCPGVHGYMEKTPGVQEAFGKLLKEREWNQSIEFIELPGYYHVVFEDGVCIGQLVCRMGKEDFLAWEASIERG